MWFKQTKWVWTLSGYLFWLVLILGMKLVSGTDGNAELVTEGSRRISFVTLPSPFSPFFQLLTVPCTPRRSSRPLSSSTQWHCFSSCHITRWLCSEGGAFPGVWGSPSDSLSCVPRKLRVAARDPLPNILGHSVRLLPIGATRGALPPLLGLRYLYFPSRSVRGSRQARGRGGEEGAGGTTQLRGATAARERPSPCARARRAKAGRWAEPRAGRAAGGAEDCEARERAGELAGERAASPPASVRPAASARSPRTHRGAQGRGRPLFCALGTSFGEPRPGSARLPGRLVATRARGGLGARGAGAAGAAFRRWVPARLSPGRALLAGLLRATVLWGSKVGLPGQVSS
jgi:hypothetical protein